MSELSRQVVYFDSEGREHYESVLRIVDARLAEGDIDCAVVFSASDEGALQAAKALSSESGHRLAVVTYRAEMKDYSEDEAGKVIATPIGLTQDAEESLKQLEVRVVRAAMPLSSEIIVMRHGDAKLSGIRETLRMFSGGCVLVVQAVLMACDAGLVREGERVVAFAADTAAVITAAHSDSMFFPELGMEIHEVLCKPSTLTISRKRIDSDRDEGQLQL